MQSNFVLFVCTKHWPIQGKYGSFYLPLLQQLYNKNFLLGLLFVKFVRRKEIIKWHKCRLPAEEVVIVEICKDQPHFIGPEIVF